MFPLFICIEYYKRILFFFRYRKWRYQTTCFFLGITSNLLHGVNTEYLRQCTHPILHMMAGVPSNQTCGAELLKHSGSTRGHKTATKHDKVPVGCFAFLRSLHNSSTQCKGEANPLSQDCTEMMPENPVIYTEEESEKMIKTPGCFSCLWRCFRKLFRRKRGSKGKRESTT